MVKKWIIKTFFKKELDETLRLASMDAFKKAHDDIMETMRDDLDKKAEELAKKKLSGLLSPVDIHRIVTIDKQRGMVFVGGDKLDSNRLSNLKSEAEFITTSDLWTLLYETPKELASKAMFVNGEDLASMQKGRSILYTLSVQRNILETFKSYVSK